jgi:hypothetical protein
MYNSRTNCIQKQISEKYFDKKMGTISLIKNNKLGKVDSGNWKYCSIEESKGLTIDNLDLTKVFNELKPFILENKTKTLFAGW